MGAFVTLPVGELITDTLAGYNYYNSSYGHCKVSYGSTAREYTLVVQNNDILFTIIDNEELYHQIYPSSVGNYLAIGGFLISKNATPFSACNYVLRNGGPESISQWFYHDITNEESSLINGKRYITSPAWLRSADIQTYSYEYTGIYADIVHINSLNELISAIDDYGIKAYSTYPITYHYTNSTVSGPTEAAVGDTVTVSAVPDVGYGITDASTQILVTNDDVAVPYTWDAANNRITFTMPQPTENRGGFGSTGQ